MRRTSLFCTTKVSLKYSEIKSLVRGAKDRCPNLHLNKGPFFPRLLPQQICIDFNFIKMISTSNNYVPNHGKESLTTTFYDNFQGIQKFARVKTRYNFSNFKGTIHTFIIRQVSVQNVNKIEIRPFLSL